MNRADRHPFDVVADHAGHRTPSLSDSSWCAGTGHGTAARRIAGGSAALSGRNAVMCHDDDSRPPSPPVVGEVAGHGLVTLTAADGNAFAAYQAVPATPNGRNVVILPDVRGLHPYYEALAVRFAEAGFHAVAFDYFGRTQGVGRRAEGFDWQSEVGKLTPEMFVNDARAAAQHVRSIHDGPDVHGRLLHGRLALVAHVGHRPRPRRLHRLLRPAVAGRRRRGVDAHPAAAARRQRGRRHPGRGVPGAGRAAHRARRSTTRCTSTTAHRTRSSTARSPSGSRPATTRGGASSRSPTASAERRPGGPMSQRSR